MLIKPNYKFGKGVISGYVKELITGTMNDIVRQQEKAVSKLESALLTYLEGYTPSESAVLEIMKNGAFKTHEGKLYRCYRSNLKLREGKFFIHRHNHPMASFSLTPDAAFKAASSYAHDNELKSKYLVVVEFSNPIVLYDHAHLVKLASKSADYVQKRTSSEQEVICLSHTYLGRVVSIHTGWQPKVKSCVNPSQELKYLTS